MGSVKATEFAAFGDPASAFTGTLVGAMGLVEEYDDIKSFKDAFDKLGLNPDWYDGGFAFLVTIPADSVDKATGAGGGSKLNIGKPSLYSSLAFAEFNYIAEDRETNTTAMNDTTNSGVVDPRGKTEVTVNNISLQRALRSAGSRTEVAEEKMTADEANRVIARLRTGSVFELSNSAYGKWSLAFDAQRNEFKYYSEFWAMIQRTPQCRRNGCQRTVSYRNSRDINTATTRTLRISLAIGIRFRPSR